MRHCPIWQWLHEVFAPGYSLWDQLAKLWKKHNNKVGLWRLAWWKKAVESSLWKALKAAHLHRRHNHAFPREPGHVSDRSKNDWLAGHEPNGQRGSRRRPGPATGIGTWLGKMVSFQICKSQNLIDMYIIWLYLVGSNVSPAILGCQSRMSYIVCGGLQPATRDAHDGRRDKILSNIKILSKISNSSIVLRTGFPCMMNFLAYKHYQKRRIGCPSSQNWKGNITRKQHIFCGLKQIITNHILSLTCFASIQWSLKPCLMIQ